MSAGHPHRRPNSKHLVELKKLLAEPTAAAMMAHPPRMVTNFDTPYTGGYPVMGNWRYLDPVFVKAVMSGQVKVPGMTPQDVLHAIWIHEFVERVIQDADNPIDTYQESHEFATTAEHAFVRTKTKPYLYERAIHPVIMAVMRKPIANVRKDFSCVPMRDGEDPEDKKILARMVQLGVTDAPKVAQESVKYGRATGKDRCIGCANWQGSRQVNPDPRVPFANLALCRHVDGAVRADRWCSRYQPMEAQNGDTNQAVPQGSTPQGYGNPAGAENPGGQDQGGRKVA